MVKYISNDELAALIKSGKRAHNDYLVVDVRDDDWAGGNITGSVNIPSREFLSGVDRLVASARDVPLVVFHCALSQARGPKAARIYEETRQNILDGANAGAQEVVVLRDGFTQFQTKFRDDPALVENWDKEVWASEWS